MRRESATVVGLTGEISGSLLTALGHSGNVSVARAPAAAASLAERAEAGGNAPQRGWEPGARAMREAARRRSMFVIVPDDPLAGVAAAWSTMWEPAAGPGAPQAFEARAADALGAWRDKQFELPDYYLVAAPAQPSAPAQPGATAPDFYLGPLRAVRPRRVAVAAVAGADAPARAALLLDTLRSLEHGPWWPPLDDLLDAVRHFYAGALAETADPA
jgi:hypothetical protein